MCNKCASIHLLVSFLRCSCFGGLLPRANPFYGHYTMLQSYSSSAIHSGHQGPGHPCRHCCCRLRLLQVLHALEQGQRQHVAVGGLDPFVVVPDDAAVFKGEFFVECQGVRVARLHVQVDLGDRWCCCCGGVVVIAVSCCPLLPLLWWGRRGGGIDAPRRLQHGLEEPGACVGAEKIRWWGELLKPTVRHRIKHWLRTDAPPPVGGLHAQRHDVEALLPVVPFGVLLGFGWI